MQRQVFREKWRICRGWLQLFFTKNPLAMGGLSLGQRFVYLGTCWAYISHIFTTPLVVAIPFIGVLLGVLPFELNRAFAMAAFVHTSATFIVHMYCTKPHHLKNCWYAAIGPQLMWYSYLHAMASALFSSTGSRNQRKTADRKQAQQPGSETPPGFKATIDLSDLEETKDVYLIITFLLISLCTGAIAIYQLIRVGPTPSLLFLLFWAIHNCVPPLLYVLYKLHKGEGGRFRLSCWLGMAGSFVFACLALLMLWLVRPELELDKVLGYCMLFFKAQVGHTTARCT